MHQKKAFLSEKVGHHGVMSEESQRSRFRGQSLPYRTQKRLILPTRKDERPAYDLTTQKQYKKSHMDTYVCKINKETSYEYQRIAGHSMLSSNSQLLSSSNISANYSN